MALGYKLHSSTIAKESTAESASKVKTTENMSNVSLGKNFSTKSLDSVHAHCLPQYFFFLRFMIIFPITSLSLQASV